MSALARGDAATPSALPRPAGELAALERVWRPPSGWRLFTAVNNTHIGLYYVATALVFFVGAGVLALVMRAQLAVPGASLVSPALYNQLFTMHGTVMMFLFAVPVVEAIAVYLLPAMLGARDLPFPRLSAYAFWAYAFGGLAFFCTVFFGVAPDGGWFMYPPLTGKAASPGPGADWWLLGIGFIEISAIAGAIELMIGILMTRAPGMSLGKMPLFAWAMLVVALMIVFAFPAVIAGTALLELERAFDWPFFIADRGGDPLLWQHLFWFFGHPEVYIIFLPAAGLVSMLVPALTRTPLVAYRAVAGGLVAVGAMSFLLWIHHMFTAGLSPLAKLLTSLASLAIAVPTALQVFAWIATLAKGRLEMRTASLFVLGFGFIFVIGGLTGVMVAVVRFDAQVHDTYFIVAHLHYVLIGGLVFPMFAALYHWTPMVNGHAFSERVGRWVFWLMFCGFHLAFFPMHVAGILGMPRRVWRYDEGLGLDLPNALSSAGAAVLATGIGLFFVDAIRHWLKKPREHDDPWRGGTLEWLPNESYGTRSIPEVHSREPLWTRPALKDEVVAGAQWLPGAVLGRRETLLTSVRRGIPLQLIVLTGDSWWPVGAGLGTAGFFLLLTVELPLPAFACGIAAVVAIWAWLWQTDRVPGARVVEVATGVMLPVGGTGVRSHSWWATAVLVVVELTIFASFAFAHLHVSMRAGVCPPPGAALPADAWAWAAIAGFVASAIGIGLAARSLPERDSTARRWRLAAMVAIAFVLVAAATATMLGMHADAGLAPRRDAWSATVGALLGWQALHAIVVALCAAYLLSRIGAGLITAASRATLDNVALLWVGVCLQGALGTALVQWLPVWMG